MSNNENISGWGDPQNDRIIESIMRSPRPYDDELAALESDLQPAPPPQLPNLPGDGDVDFKSVLRIPGDRVEVTSFSRREYPGAFSGARQTVRYAPSDAGRSIIRDENVVESDDEYDDQPPTNGGEKVPDDIPEKRPRNWKRIGVAVLAVGGLLLVGDKLIQGSDGTHSVATKHITPSPAPVKHPKGHHQQLQQPQASPTPSASPTSPVASTVDNTKFKFKSFGCIDAAKIPESVSHHQAGGLVSGVRAYEIGQLQAGSHDAYRLDRTVTVSGTALVQGCLNDSSAVNYDPTRSNPQHAIYTLDLSKQNFALDATGVINTTLPLTKHGIVEALRQNPEFEEARNIDGKRGISHDRTLKPLIIQTVANSELQQLSTAAVAEQLEQQALAVEIPAIEAQAAKSGMTITVVPVGEVSATAADFTANQQQPRLNQACDGDKWCDNVRPKDLYRVQVKKGIWNMQVLPVTEAQP